MLGSWRKCNGKPSGFKWPYNSIYALGVHFSYDPVLASKLNFERKVYNLEKNSKQLVIPLKLNSRIGPELKRETNFCSTRSPP